MARRRPGKLRGSIEKRDDGWWITGFDFVGWPDHGPYETKADAHEDQVGLTFQYRDNKEYWDADQQADNQSNEVRRPGDQGQG